MRDRETSFKIPWWWKGSRWRWGWAFLEKRDGEWGRWVNSLLFVNETFWLCGPGVRTELRKPSVPVPNSSWVIFTSAKVPIVPRSLLTFPQIRGVHSCIAMCHICLSLGKKSHSLHSTRNWSHQLVNFWMLTSILVVSLLNLIISLLFKVGTLCAMPHCLTTCTVYGINFHAKQSSESGDA
jgi:hypothetical protein